jgi:Kef-type K+ transport system membrane component KefB
VFHALWEFDGGGNILYEIGLCIVAATVLGYLARILKQPLLLGYIAAGLTIGPAALGLIKDEKSITHISELGLAFLMFIVGMEIDIKKLVQSAKVAGVTTLVQVIVCGIIGWLAAIVLIKVGLVGGDDKGMHALYLGTCTAFSSTMIAVKVLSDKSELDTVAGRIALGILLFQDVLAIVVLALQPNIADPALGTMGLAAAKGLGLAVGATLISRYILPVIFRFAAKSPEILMILAISWCFLVAYAAIKADFSSAMGALIAGVSIGAFPYSVDVIAKLRSLRDFFVTLFFVALGMQIQIASMGTLAAALILSVLVLFNRFIPVIPTLKFLGYDRRVGILASLSIAQVSEFSLVIAGIGLSAELGHISKEIVSIVAISMVVTCTVSTYLIMANQKIALWFSRKQMYTETRKTEAVTEHSQKPIVLIGTHRVGSSLIPILQQEGKDFLLIDFSPEVHKRAQSQGIPSLYGDISHMDTLEHAGVEHAKILISSISDDFLRGTDNMKLFKLLRRLNPTAKIVVSSESASKALELYEAGADYVILPRKIVAQSLIEVIRQLEAGSGQSIKEAEIEELKVRNEIVL